MENKETVSRNVAIDIAKGLLILCVIIGHGTKNQSLSDFMYRFHMPLFLILSGCFLKKVEDVKTYLNRIIHYLYGGRFINGVYWYITSLYIALVAAVILLDKLNKKQLIAIGIVGGVQQ